MSKVQRKSSFQSFTGSRSLEIEKREQLRTLLIKKFKTKYSNHSDIDNLIETEVQKFLNSDRLTEKNLKLLDQKILTLISQKKTLSQIFNDYQSQRSQSAVSRHSAARSQGGLSVRDLNQFNTNLKQNNVYNDVKSISQRSKSSYRPNIFKTKNELRDNTSVVSDQKNYLPYSDKNEAEEWNNIQKFNTQLHFEEQKALMHREAERKRLIKEELERQIFEKKGKMQEENYENEKYNEMAQEHVKLLAERDQKKQENQKEKTMNDKLYRDAQLQQERRRKRKEEQEELSKEIENIRRLKSEMQEEKRILLEKRRQEREYLQLMLKENEANKTRQKEVQKREQLNDLKAQQQYIEMQAQQAKDRLEEAKKRESRTQNFMNQMADSVLQKQEQKQKQEDEMLARYENQKEIRARQLEEIRIRKQREDQERMREFLKQQMDEKRNRENQEKNNIAQQAHMWQVDKENYEQEAKRLKERTQIINKENKSFLIMQMQDKYRKDNKPLPI